jgi:signal transduction histidine kinase/DNA-binding response OmpR family regulator/HAMP domain-containing protein
VTRVAREVGTEGKLGGQAEVKGVAGTWKDLTDNVNFMAGNLTSQVRGIAKVVTAVARGDLKQKLTVEAKGEIAELADTINGMTETLATFADQVTTVAREVGVEGKLGGQASVPGASGTWKDLTDNVNQLAGNLTTQVRAIADVATAVTKGDLTRSIKVEAQGEVAALKDNINEMIRNLKETTLTNKEQDWLKTNLAKFSRMLQGQKDRVAVGNLILGELAPVVSAQHGMLFTMEHPKDEAGTQPPFLKLLASYAYDEIKSVETLALGQGLVGQCAKDKQKIVLSQVPENYIKISSSLGQTSPENILILPVLFEGQVKGVMELASLERFSPTHQVFLDQLMESIGIVLNTIEANMRTEDLLEQSQSLAKQLQSRQEELQKTNQELEIKARLLADQNQEVERKNKEVEQARSALEEKAKQLALTSKYKSEFLANMSHELRTPLNSLLILSDQLYRNQDGNLTPKQVDFAKTIHASGNDLLALINDILDLSKIESGTVTVEPSDLALGDLQDYVDRQFRHVAENKGLNFALDLKPGVPGTMHTDAKRLQQVLKNLLSNAFKFTEEGTVALNVSTVTSGWNPENETLNRSKSVLAFAVTDTGIGIHPDKQQIIFEAFQQADGSTSRKYGGTGLGLAISREISRMLGGEIKLMSSPGHGSTFTLYLPKNYMPPKSAKKQTTTTSTNLDQDEIKTTTTKIAYDVPAVAEVSAPSVFTNEIGDDRGTIHDNDRVILIVDNDLGFARILVDLARESGFKCIATSQGAVAVALAREYKPHAVTLDIRLPDMDGWRVLDRLKNDPETRHIPVYIVSAADERVRGLSQGALGYLNKPIKTREPLEQAIAQMKQFSARPVKNILVAERDEALRKNIVDLLSAPDVQASSIGTGKGALAAMMDRHFDCISIGQELPDMTGLEVLEAVNREPRLREIPIIFNTLRALDETEEETMRRLSSTSVIKIARSTDRILLDSSLFLHREINKLPETVRNIFNKLQQSSSVLAGKKVLVVDDDIRNIFALMSVLERQKIIVLSAENGHDAIKLVEKEPNIDAVLMDIMMPAMDGYDTMREIRKRDKFKELPIIAVTAKAMKGDREKCIEAGATDYLAKPVDTEQLLSLLRVVLYN